MCLIINKPAGVAFNEAWLEDFFSHNRDGFGFMYEHNGGPIVVKYANPTVEDFIDEMESINHKSALIHLRMRTHGEINDANTHPYKICDGLWVMHNGIIGHAATDQIEMSDTWHYIRDTLAPILKTSPEVLQTKAFQNLIGDHIGNNRLAFMDGKGRFTIINKDQGVMFNGCWLSNTYAWSYAKRNLVDPQNYVPEQKHTKNGTAFKHVPFNQSTYGLDDPMDDYVYERNDIFEMSENTDMEDFCFNNYDIASQMLVEFGVTLADMQEFQQDIKEGKYPSYLQNSYYNEANYNDL